MWTFFEPQKEMIVKSVVFLKEKRRKKIMSGTVLDWTIYIYILGSNFGLLKFILLESIELT